MVWLQKLTTLTGSLFWYMANIATIFPPIHMKEKTGTKFKVYTFSRYELTNVQNLRNNDQVQHLSIFFIMKLE